MDDIVAIFKHFGLYCYFHLIFHTFNASLTGLLYRSSTEVLLLELGCSLDYYLTPMLIDLLSTAAHLKDTWKFLSSHQIVLHHDICFPLSRQRDQLIMEAFSSLNCPWKILKFVTTVGCICEPCIYLISSQEMACMWLNLLGMIPRTSLLIN